MRSARPLILFALIFVFNSVSYAQQNFKQVGLGSGGLVAFEYIGVVQQNAADFATNGYFTSIHGLPDDLLFFPGGDRDQKHARFTFQSRSKMVNRSVVNKVFSVNVQGDMNIYMRRAKTLGSSMEDDQSFRVGELIATMDMRGQSIVAVTKPNSGVNSAVLELEQTKSSWKAVSLLDRTFTFGRPGTRFRLSHIGRGEQAQQTPIVATITIAGHAISTSQESRK